MKLIGRAVQFRGQVLDSRLQEKDVSKATLLRSPVNLLGDFFQWARIGVYADVKLPRVPARALVYKETVSGPDIQDYSFACRAR